MYEGEFCCTESCVVSSLVQSHVCVDEFCTKTCVWVNSAVHTKSCGYKVVCVRVSSAVQSRVFCCTKLW